MITITYYGHSCFKVSAEDASVVFDPYKEGSVPGLRLPDDLSAVQVLCSHDHGDHNASELVHLVKGTEVPVVAIASFHDDQGGQLRGKSLIHVVELDGVRIAHFGDIGCALTTEQIEQLRHVDVALVPVGGYYTIDAEQCKRMCNQIEPKCTILMHYRNGEVGYDVLSSLEDVRKVFVDTQCLSSSVLSFEKSEVPHGVFTLVPVQK